MDSVWCSDWLQLDCAEVESCAKSCCQLPSLGFECHASFECGQEFYPQSAKLL